MASDVYGALAIVLIVGGVALAGNFRGLAERVVEGLRPGADVERIRRWRVMGISYVIAGMLLLVVALVYHCGNERVVLIV